MGRDSGLLFWATLYSSDVSLTIMMSSSHWRQLDALASYEFYS